MSNALEALMNLSNDDIAAYTSEPETEDKIVIGNDRRVFVPENLKRIAVQYDHNIETVTFDCPRYWDDHDMSKMIVYINYRLPNGELGGYMATNIKASGDRITFDWTILKDVTQYKGNLAFLVCIKKTDSDGLEVNHWNSELCSDMYISEGLETIEHVMEDYPDLVNQLLERMTAVEQINVQADEMQVLHDETLDAAEAAETARTEALAVKESVDASEQHIRNSYANAIRNSASGSFIRVDDVSPIEHMVKTKVRSKNLIPLPYDEVGGEKSGATFTVLEDGGIQVIGTPTSNTSFNLTMQYKKRLLVEKGKTYTVSVTSTLTDARGYVFIQNWANGEAVDNESLRRGSLTFIPSENGSMQIGIVLLKGQVYDEVMYIWLEEGSAATDYSTYVDPSTVTVTVCGKNMFDVNGYTTVVGNLIVNEKSGNTYTVQGAVGTSTNSYASGAFSIDLPNAIPIESSITVSMYVTMLEQGAYDNRIRVWSVDRDLTFVNYVTTELELNVRTKIVATFTAANIESLKRISLYLNNNKCLVELDTLQIETGSEVTDYKPYISSTNLTSVSPTMTVMSNKNGVILDVDYNVDTKMYIDSKLDGGISAALEAIMNDSY